MCCCKSLSSRSALGSKVPVVPVQWAVVVLFSHPSRGLLWCSRRGMSLRSASLGFASLHLAWLHCPSLASLASPDFKSFQLSHVFATDRSVFQGAKADDPLAVSTSTGKEPRFGDIPSQPWPASASSLLRYSGTSSGIKVFEKKARIS